MADRDRDRNRDRGVAPPAPPWGGRWGGIALSLFLSLSLGCPSTPGSREAADRDLERDILWDLRKDPKLADVRVKCLNRAITLEGTVPDAAARNSALQIASRHAFGSSVDSKIVIRPR